MKNTFRLLMICSAGLLLGLFSSPVFAYRAQPTRAASYLAYPLPSNEYPIYLPLIRVPLPYPNTPQLNPISNAENGSYTINWAETPKQNATSYNVQEAADIGFTQGLSNVCTTSQLNCALSGKIAGTFYYRVMGVNSYGSSTWSNVQTAVVLLPEVPFLLPINNSDWDNLFSVNWNIAGRAVSYILQESTDSTFGSSTAEYISSNQSWITPNPGKTPSTYSYRLKSRGSTGDSGWSTTQTITINPLFVGLKIRWDGNGYIRGSEYYDLGTHETLSFNSLIDSDTIRGDSAQWYAPDPLSIGPSSWYSFYSPSTGEEKVDGVPGDPSWKWGYSWRLAYNSQFTSGATVLIYGQKFTVTGPQDGYTPFGKPIKYWQFVNQEKFLFWDGGGDWKQYIHVGDITLRYDAGSSKLILYDNIIRRRYYQGAITSDTVQYIEFLSSSTSISGSPAFAPTTFEPTNLSQDKYTGRNQVDRMPISK